MTQRFTSTLSLLVVLALVGCGDGTAPIDPTPSSVLTVQGDQQTGTVGGSLEVDPTVEVRNADGQPLPDITVTWAVVSGNGSVSPTSSTTDETGRASSSWTLGTSTEASHRLRATAGAVSATFEAVPRPGEPHRLEKVSGDDQVGLPGQTLPDSVVVQVVDEFGNGVPGVVVEFEVDAGSVSPTSATTGDRGRAATAVTLPGEERTVEVRARWAEIQTVTFSSTAAIAPLTIATEKLDRGRETLAYGAGLEATGGSEEGYAWSLIDGSLPEGLALDPDGRISGTPASQGSRSFTLQVTDSEENTATRGFTLTVCEAPLSLETGEILTGSPRPEGECGFFLPSGQDGDRYRVGVMAATTSESGASGTVTLSVQRFDDPEGAPAMVASSGAGIQESVSQESVRPFVSMTGRHFRQALERDRATRELHERLRRQERELVERMPPEALLRERPGIRAAGDGPLRTTPPEKRTFNPVVPSSGCGTDEEGDSTVTAIRLGYNDHVVIYQDSAQNQEEPVTESHARDMLDYYRDYGKPVIDQYFGGVSDIDDSGRVAVFVTPEVGENLAAFVWSGDFFTANQCAASNEMEITYFSAGVIRAMDDGVHQALGTLVHEVKHISSLYKRIVARQNHGEAYGLHPLWIEEGTADIAGNMSSRIAWAETGGPAEGDRVTATSFQQTGVSPENWGVFFRMARTVWYLSSQPNGLTTTPSAAQQGHDIRGSGWHFHRFLGDGYAPTPRADSTFFREQNDSTSIAGIAWMEEKTGKSFTELLEEYTGAIMLNGTMAPEPEPSFSSYEFSTATGIFCRPNPLGDYPWPVTTTGTAAEFDDDCNLVEEEEATAHAPFDTDTFRGPIGASGLRVHELRSQGTGQGIEINVELSGPHPARVVITRLR